MTLARAERLGLGLFLFLVSFQARIFVAEIGQGPGAGEWTQVWVWASDIALFLVLFCWWRSGITRRDFAPLAVLLLFLPATIAHVGALSLWSFVKIAECVVLFCYVRVRGSLLYRSRFFVAAFFSGLWCQALIATAQFFVQHDLGLRFLDESVLSPELPGVAKFSVAGARVIRAYGLTPHPNILAAFMGIGLLAVAVLYVGRGVRWLPFYSFQRQRQEFVFGLSFFSFALALLLSFSRLGWFATIGALALFLLLLVSQEPVRRQFVFKGIRFVVLSIGVLLILLHAFSPFLRARADILPSEQGVVLREFYGGAALRMIAQSPLVGVGTGHFTEMLSRVEPNFPAWMYQPVHNVFLLIAAEDGIFAAVGAFVLFLSCVLLLFRHMQQVQNAHERLFFAALLSSLALLFVFSLGDHFLWTSQQGRFLLFFILGLTAGARQHSAGMS